MAHEIARFPQAALLADRKSAIEGHGLPVGRALEQEWRVGIHAHLQEGASGGARFAGGLGRSGDFDRI